MHMLGPIVTPYERLVDSLRADGSAVLDARGLCALTHNELGELEALRPSWDDLPPDTYLRDGGRYRRRRHSCFIVEDGSLRQAPHRAHWQPLDYNALHGGIERWFEPISSRVVTSACWARLLIGLAATFSSVKGERTWHIEAHQFRIDTTDGIGRPTPEGAHRDGVDFVAVIVVQRFAIKGGETRVFEARGPRGQRFTLSEPWSALLLDDERVIHESTPIQPLETSGHRDTLVLTFRARGFQTAPL